MITGYIVDKTFLDIIVPSDFYINNIDENLTFRDYTNWADSDIEGKAILFVGKKIGECYDSRVTNPQAWEKYFSNSGIGVN